MPRSTCPPLAGGERGAIGKVLADHQATPSPASLQVADAARWVLRQPFADLAELAGRRWLRCFSLWTRLCARAVWLRAELTVAELARDKIGEALEEAAELAEGQAALAHARTRERADA